MALLKSTFSSHAAGDPFVLSASKMKTVFTDSKTDEPDSILHLGDVANQ